MKDLLTKMAEAVTYIQKQIKHQPTIGLVLGSGLGDLANELEEKVVIDYGTIPHFPSSTVAGHAGELVIGKVKDKTVVAMKGRFHYYEGYTMQEVTFPIRVMKGLGIDTLIVTNACGGMNPNFQPGDLMIITDHINMMGNNPLIGPNAEELGPRFPDMSQAYTPLYIELAKQVAKKMNIPLQQGVYVAISGPTYSTPAETKMFRNLGGDAIGMSTVPEVIVASHMKLKVLGISCVTDRAIGEELEPLTHEEVVAVANRTKPIFTQLVREVIAAM